MAGKPTASVAHEARFSFRAQGGDCAGRRWIYDGQVPIARFEHREIDQPEQEMRYFNAVPRPINLCDLVLAPGGRPLVAGVQLYWVLRSRLAATTELLDVTVAGQASDRLELTFLARDPAGVATSRRVLTVTYDPQLAGYVYDFACHLDVHSPEFFDEAGEVTLEYSDPWYSDVPAPLIEFPGMWPKHAQSHLVSEEADGSIRKLPLNHTAMAAVGRARLRRDGLFVLAYETKANPAIQLVGATADRSAIGVCPWGYDVHLALNLNRQELRRPICPRFRIFNCPDDRARDLLARAEPAPRIKLAGMSTLPLYERKTSFEKGCRLSEPPGTARTDPCFWTPSLGDKWPCRPYVGEADPQADPDCLWLWDDSTGRSDHFSLKIQRRTEGPAEWRMIYDNQAGFGEPSADLLHIRVAGWIRTDRLEGQGACLALRHGIYNSTERYPYICSRRVAGTADWTRVDVEIRGCRPPDSNAVYIILRHDGAGTSWFDDLEVEFLPVGERE